MPYATYNVEEQLQTAMIAQIGADVAASGVPVRAWRSAATVEQYPVYVVHADGFVPETGCDGQEHLLTGLLSVGAQTDIAEDRSATIVGRMLGNVRGFLHNRNLAASLTSRAAGALTVYGVDIESGTQDQSSERIYSRGLTARVSLSF